MASLAPNAPQRPREWRRRVSIAARIKLGTDWADGHTLNISSRGMLLHHSRPIAIGSQIEVRNDGRAVSATVVWQDGFRAGLTCAQRIDLGDWVCGMGGAGRSQERIRPGRGEGQSAGGSAQPRPIARTGAQAGIHRHRRLCSTDRGVGGVACGIGPVPALRCNQRGARQLAGPAGLRRSRKFPFIAE
ncbi:MAG: PilZ domain-containing protein [Sphingomonas sp.]|nr:PilZ domain-containing protein [Sphingomonas sp.]